MPMWRRREHQENRRIARMQVRSGRETQPSRIRKLEQEKAAARESRKGNTTREGGRNQWRPRDFGAREPQRASSSSAMAGDRALVHRNPYGRRTSVGEHGSLSSSIDLRQRTFQMGACEDLKVEPSLLPACAHARTTSPRGTGRRPQPRQQRRTCGDRDRAPSWRASSKALARRRLPAGGRSRLRLRARRFRPRGERDGGTRPLLSPLRGWPDRSCARRPGQRAGWRLRPYQRIGVRQPAAQGRQYSRRPRVPQHERQSRARARWSEVSFLYNATNEPQFRVRAASDCILAASELR